LNAPGTKDRIKSAFRSDGAPRTKLSPFERTCRQVDRMGDDDWEKLKREQDQRRAETRRRP